MSTATDSSASVRPCAPSSAGPTPSATPATTTPSATASRGSTVTPMSAAPRWSSRLTRVYPRPAATGLSANWTEETQFVLAQKEKLEIHLFVAVSAWFLAGNQL